MSSVNHKTKYKEFSLTENQIKMKATAEILDGQLWIHIDGHTLNLDLESISNNGQLRKKKKSLSANPNIILAPMPGKITKILLNINQKVQLGDAVIVMEAMKMEYTLKSNMNGVIKSLNAKLGDQVTLGSLLVEIENQNNS